MRKRRKKRGNQFFSSLMIVILLPLLVTTVMQSMKLEKLISGQSVYVESATEAVYESGEGSLLWGGSGETEETEQNRELEQKVLFVAAKEIGADYEDAAIMAQCVIARTNLYDAAKNQTAEPQGLSMEEMQTLWGEDFNRIYQKFSECAEKTADEVLTWDGSYAPVEGDKIAYFSEEFQMEHVPAQDIPTIGPVMKHIPLVAEPRRIAVRYDQITAFQA